MRRVASRELLLLNYQTVSSHIASPRFEGFLQVYQLQTESDEEETWRDLVSSTTRLYSHCAKFYSLFMASTGR